MESYLNKATPKKRPKKRLEKRLENSVRLDWGGVLALDRRLLDLTLREQYLDALADFGGMSPISVDAYLDDAERMSVSLEGLVMGPPQVSFENSTGFNQNLMVRMSILAGEYKLVVQLPGSPKRVVESFTITEAMGYRVEAPLSLRTRRPKNSRYTLLELDLASVVEFSNNLGPTEYVRIVLGRRLQQFMGYMRAYQRTYSLGRFVMDDYYPLSPEQFMVRTQVAPWGQSKESPRYGDGGVMVFMKLGIDLLPGRDPGLDVDIPYPIAEDATGLPGALILVPDINDLGAGDYREVLKTFSLPNGYEFVPGTPKPGVDLVVPGSWEPKQQAVALEPAFANVISGQRLPFTVTGAGALSATNLTRPAATGTFNGAVYSPRAVASFAEQQQMVLVTAPAETGVEGGRHALVIESARAMHAAPRTATWVQGDDPIELHATSVDFGPLEWSLEEAAHPLGGESRFQKLDEALGKLEDKGDGRATFTPNPPGGNPGFFTVQRLRCTNLITKESVESAVVIIRFHPSLTMQPFHVAQAQSLQPTRFKVVEDGNPAVTWTVYGEGTFEGNVYMPPESPQLPIAVVTASDGVARTGYSIVEFSEGRQSATGGLLSWEAISTFELRALGAPKCFANGWQQIEVEVKVAAADDHNGQPVEISDADLATLKFFNTYNNNEVAFLAPYSEAMGADEKDHAKSEGVEKDWAVNRDANNINRQVSSSGKSNKPLAARLRRFYFHCQAPGTLEVYAYIQNTVTGKEVTSEKLANGKLELTGLRVPSFTQEQYSLKRTRVTGDASPSPGDSFAYIDHSTDNWLLEHVLDGGHITKFARLYISDADNKSGVRWSWKPMLESDPDYSPPVPDDDFVSYTGFSFTSLDNSIQDKLVYDGLLYRMAKHRDYSLLNAVPGTRPGAGQLMITLRRDTGFVFAIEGEGRGYRQALEKDLIVTLLDENGNSHPLTFTFAVTAEEEREGITHRDVLKLSIR